MRRQALKRPPSRRATGLEDPGARPILLTGSALFAAYLSCVNLAATPASPAAVDSTDNNQPYTDSWSVNVDRVTPWQGLLEIGYARSCH